MNFGATSAGDTVVSLGAEKAMANSNDNFSFTPAATGEYRFTVKATNPTSPTLTVTLGDVYANAIFLKGSLNGWADVDEMLYVGEGLYRVTINVAAGSYEFKVADSSWSAPNIGVGADGDTLNDDGSLKIEVASNPGNIKLEVASTNDYVFTLDTRDATKPTLHMVPATRFSVAAFVRGSMNGWSEADPLVSLGNNLYQADIALTAGGYEFKVASADWSTIDRTAGGQVKTYEPIGFIPGLGQSNSTLQVSADATLRFLLDANFAEPKMTVTVAP